MIKEALEYLLGLGETEILELGYQKYTTKPIHHVREPEPEALYVNTLSGMVEYIRSRIEKEEVSLSMLHIADYDMVYLISVLNTDNSRHKYIIASAPETKFHFGRFLPLEEFLISLQACFVQSEDKGKTLKIIGNIKDENVRSYGDDGISQQVTAKVGLASVEDVKVPNPVRLAPFRTFREIEQPESEFVFRMRNSGNGPECALFEADGGAWKIDAMIDIKAFLEERLKGVKIPIIC